MVPRGIRSVKRKRRKDLEPWEEVDLWTEIDKLEETSDEEMRSFEGALPISGMTFHSIHGHVD